MLSLRVDRRASRRTRFTLRSLGYSSKVRRSFSNKFPEYSGTIDYTNRRGMFIGIRSYCTTNAWKIHGDEFASRRHPRRTPQLEKKEKTQRSSKVLNRAVKRFGAVCTSRFVSQMTKRRKECRAMNYVEWGPPTGMIAN